MATNILAHHFAVPMSDYRAIDISVDVHIERVLPRLGFVKEGASKEEIIDATRQLYPDYPGIFDVILWDIGRNHCHPKDPECADCRLSGNCGYAIAISS